MLFSVEQNRGQRSCYFLSKGWECEAWVIYKSVLQAKLHNFDRGFIVIRDDNDSQSTIEPPQ